MPKKRSKSTPDPTPIPVPLPAPKPVPIPSPDPNPTPIPVDLCTPDAKNNSSQRVDLDQPLPFFTYKACPYFPCHTTDDDDNFNCLFCFCPLYTLGSNCGGNFTYTQAGIKDCSQCVLPHEGNNGNTLVNKKFSELAALAGQNNNRV